VGVARTARRSAGVRPLAADCCLRSWWEGSLQLAAATAHHKLPRGQESSGGRSRLRPRAVGSSCLAGRIPRCLHPFRRRRLRRSASASTRRVTVPGPHRRTTAPGTTTGRAKPARDGHPLPPGNDPQGEGRTRSSAAAAPLVPMPEWARMGRRSAGTSCSARPTLPRYIDNRVIASTIHAGPFVCLPNLCPCQSSLSITPAHSASPVYCPLGL